MVESKTVLDSWSASSLILKLYFDDLEISQGTGFVVEHKGQAYLVSNWHMFSGYHPDSGQAMNEMGALPNQIKIFHHGAEGLGTWIPITQSLVAKGSGKQMWIDHPDGKEVDLALLPLTNTEGVKLYPVNLQSAVSDMKTRPAMSVSIIGFPLGFSGSGLLPIWKTGHIASEPDVNHDDKPLFLIDATTRSGMSGSPVVQRSYGGYETEGGGIAMNPKPVSKFLGVYSGRLHADVEIGRVWKPTTISDILNTL